MSELYMQEHPQLTVLVAGDFMIDQYLYSTVSRVSPEAPVPIAKVQRTERRIGGAGNVALNILALGSRVKIVTCIGTDTPAEELLCRLRCSGADTTCIYQDKKRQTSLKTRIVAQNQQLLRYDEEEIVPADETFWAYLQENADAVFSGVHGVVLSDYGKGILTPEIAQFMIQQAKKRGIPVLVDPKGNDYSKYTGATICTPNLKELTEVSGQSVLRTEEEIRCAALELCGHAELEYVLATRSEKGMSLISRKLRTKQDFPAVVQEVCDVTGAGDTVISVMAVCMSAGESMDRCCRLSNMAASVVVAKFGAATANVGEINAAILAEKQRAQIPQKVLNTEKLAEQVRQLQSGGKKVVFTNGCFDLVHAGHIASFRQARSYGDVLVVAVNSDASIKRLKGPARPVVDLANRIKLLEALEMVDYVIPFEEDTPLEIIEAIRPDILVKGKDWEGKEVAGMDILKSYGGQVVFVDLEQGLSTTAIVEKIRSNY